MSANKITPFLWFNNNLEEALEFYQSVFPNASVNILARWQQDFENVPKGAVMTATFELEGQKFMALNGGPMFKFNESVSFFIECNDQQEVDHYWEKLTEGGSKSRCGWLKDRFGLSWQVVPKQLGELMYGKDKSKSGKVMQAMMQMDKIVIADLEKAAGE